MDNQTNIFIAVIISIAAFLYSSVGHAGASGYLATMALFGLDPAIMKPTALTLNILVASIATVKFYRAGYFSWNIFYPFAVTSVPFAFIGGMITIPSQSYKIVVGLVLIYSAYRLLFYKNKYTDENVKKLPFSGALFSGSVIGLLSGLTGVGGGIFLSPLLLIMGWSDTKKTSGVSAMFILVNSVAGLLGHLSSIQNIPPEVSIWAIGAVTGGWFGAEYGSRKFGNTTIRKFLSFVLIIAGFKMILT